MTTAGIVERGWAIREGLNDSPHGGPALRPLHMIYLPAAEARRRYRDMIRDLTGKTPRLKSSRRRRRPAKP